MEQNKSVSPPKLEMVFRVTFLTDAQLIICVDEKAGGDAIIITAASQPYT